MNAEERAVIDGIFDRLKNVANQQRDAEAERYIADRIREQPYAPYALAQSVYVQEQALINQQQQIEQLQAEIAEMRKAAPQPQQGQAGGFLSGLFGGNAQQPQRDMPAYGQRGQSMAAAPQQGGPWSGQPQQQPAAGPWGGQAAQAQPPQKQGMGFLGTAAAAAAGVAGGMMIGNLLSSAFGGGQAHARQPSNDILGQHGQSPFGLSDHSRHPADHGTEQGYEEEAGDWGGDMGGDDTYEA